MVGLGRNERLQSGEQRRIISISTGGGDLSRSLADGVLVIIVKVQIHVMIALVQDYQLQVFIVGGFQELSQ